MRLRRVVIILLVVLLLGALVVPGAMAKKADKMVPLKGSFEGVVGEPFYGNFTHLGRFEGVVTFSDPSGEGAATWTAANGDEMNNTSFFTITGGSFPVFEYEQTFVIEPGTGRFECTTGMATATGTIDFLSGEYDGYLEGMISQPNKCPS